MQCICSELFRFNSGVLASAMAMPVCSKAAPVSARHDHLLAYSKVAPTQSQDSTQCTPTQCNPTQCNQEAVKRQRTGRTEDVDWANVEQAAAQAREEALAKVEHDWCGKPDGEIGTQGTDSDSQSESTKRREKTSSRQRMLDEWGCSKT